MKLEQPVWPEQLPPDAVVTLATLGPLGTKMKAPGTWGSAAGILFFFLCLTPLTIIDTIAVSMVLGYLAVGICGQAEVQMRRKDPGEVILDEFVAMPLCFIGWRMIVGPTGLPGFIGLVIAAFALFRFYDIRKPWVINALQELPGGWGIVVDDTAAALATCGTLHLAHAFWHLIPLSGNR
jgi:phosphatidylglycerophosphatase A